MTFNTSQKNFIKTEFNRVINDEKGCKYHLVYKENNEYKSTWSLTDNPKWDWDLYEYRLLKILDRPLNKSEVEDVFVYVYNGMVYYNDPNNELHVSYLNGRDENNAFTTVMATYDNLNIMGKTATFGDSLSYDAILCIKGITDYNNLDTVTYLIGPKLQFQVDDDKSKGWLAITYCDQQQGSTGEVQKNSPYLKAGSIEQKELIVVPRQNVKNLVVKNKVVTTSTIKNAKVSNLSATVKFNDIQQICKNFFPVGCFYWTSNADFIPSEHFGGEWERVVNTFIYASISADKNVTTARWGEWEHKLTYNELGSHSHIVTDYGHIHSVNAGIHYHSINDPGHMHSVRTIGDDYNGSNCRDQGGSGNFVQDGWWDMSSINWSRGFYFNRSYTNIGINNAGSQITVNSSISNCRCQPNVGGEGPHNNMPPYLRAFCWHRIK